MNQQQSFKKVEKIEKKRIHINSKSNIIFLKMKNNHEFFNIPSKETDNNLISSILHLMIRNPYIGNKFSEKLYFMKGSGDKLTKSFSLLVEHLFKENMHYNSKELNDSSFHKLNPNSNSSLNLREENAINGVSMYSLMKTIYDEINFDKILSDRNSKLIDEIRLEIIKNKKSNGKNFNLNMNSNTKNNKIEENNGNEILTFIDSDSKNNFKDKINQIISRSQTNICSFFYKKIIESLNKKYLLKGSVRIKTSEINNFLSKRIRKRQISLFETVFIGIDIDTFSCKNCETTKINFIPYTSIKQIKESFKDSIEKKYFSTILPEYFCEKCELPTYYRTTHKKSPLIFPKIIYFKPDKSLFKEEIENSFVISNFQNEVKIYKNFGCLKNTIKENVIEIEKINDNLVNRQNLINYIFNNYMNSCTFSSMLKFEDDSIYEFGPNGYDLLYKNENFQINNSSIYEGFFYYDTNFKLSINNKS